MWWPFKRKAPADLSILPPREDPVGLPYWMYGDRFLEAFNNLKLPVNTDVDVTKQFYSDGTQRVWQLQIRRRGLLFCAVNFQYNWKFERNAQLTDDPWDSGWIRIKPGTEYGMRGWRYEFNAKTGFDTALRIALDLTEQYNGTGAGAST